MENRAGSDFRYFFDKKGSSSDFQLAEEPFRSFAAGKGNGPLKIIDQMSAKLRKQRSGKQEGTA